MVINCRLQNAYPGKTKFSESSIPVDGYRPRNVEMYTWDSVSLKMDNEHKEAMKESWGSNVTLKYLQK